MIHVYWTFAEGIKDDLVVTENLLNYVKRLAARQMEALGLEIIENESGFEERVLAHFQDDEELCAFAKDQARLVEQSYKLLTEAQEIKDGKHQGKPTAILTKEYIGSIIGLLQHVRVPPSRWTRDYHQEQMEAMYEMLRGRNQDNGEIFWDAPEMNEAQAANVIWLLDEYFGWDQWQTYLAVPKYRDSLYTGDDYHWCENCGAVHWEDMEQDDEDNDVCPFCATNNEEEEE